MGLQIHSRSSTLLPKCNTYRTNRCITGKENSYKLENKLYKRYPNKQEQITRTILWTIETEQETKQLGNI